MGGDPFENGDFLDALRAEAARIRFESAPGIPRFVSHASPADLFLLQPGRRLWVDRYGDIPAEDQYVGMLKRVVWTRDGTPFLLVFEHGYCIPFAAVKGYASDGPMSTGTVSS